MTNNRIITRRQAADRIGGDISIRTLDRLAADPRNGIKLIQISERRVGVLESSIDAYIKRSVRVRA